MEVIQDGNKMTIHNGTWETGSENSKTETKEKESTHTNDTVATNLKQVEKETINLKQDLHTKDSTENVDKKQYNIIPAGVTAAVIFVVIVLILLKRRKNENTKDITA